MINHSKLTFTLEIKARRNYIRITPVVDGTSLRELVTAYETSHSFETAGGYAGVVLGYRSAADHFLGERLRNGRIVQLLGCDCCDGSGCWPLECRIRITNDQVLWTSFRQPHRSERDYSGFGPFAFSATHYRAALHRAELEYRSLYNAGCYSWGKLNVADRFLRPLRKQLQRKAVKPEVALQDTFTRLQEDTKVRSAYKEVVFRALQLLSDIPGAGLEFIEAGLRSEAPSQRVLAAWTLSKWPVPQLNPRVFWALRIARQECDDDTTRSAIDALLEKEPPLPGEQVQ